MPIPLGAVPDPPRMIEGDQADIDVNSRLRDRALAVCTDRRSTPAGLEILERPACFEIVPMATRSGVSRQIRSARSFAVPPPLSEICDDALTRAYGEIVHRPGFWPRRAWSDLLFTMSDNTHRSKPYGRTHQANASVRIDVFGRATSLPMQQCEQAMRALGGAEARHTRMRVRPSFGASKLRRSQQTGSGHTVAGLVEPDGIEPTTSCLQSRRSPN